MKKVLLITLQGDNIGNRLQNYALQEVLKNMGCKVYTPYYRLREFNTVIKRLKFCIKVGLGIVGVKKYKPEYIRAKRIRVFSTFDARYIDNRFRIEFDEVLSKQWDDYDFAITGSDQVWHGWTNNPNELRYFYLEFTEQTKRISYAPSFGFSTFPKNSIKEHEKGLSGIKYLSCREKKGVKLIKELVGRESELVLDPTLLLWEEEWIKIEKKPDWYDGKKYLLTYFLGNNHYVSEFEKFSKDNDIQIIDVYDRLSLRSNLITPDVFIWLIRHAEYVCTDSFHATVFSIIFKKLFLSFRRQEDGMENMFDRIEDLLDLYELSDKVYDGKIEHIYSTYETRDISAFKEKSIEFLRKSLDLDIQKVLN